MVATAFDERISLGAPAGSSGAGTGAYRFCGPGGGKEGVEDMTRKYGYYFVPRLAEFTGQMQKLPFDAHWVDRAHRAASVDFHRRHGRPDCVPNAVKQSVLAAQPVYQFLACSTNRVGVNYEPHRHVYTGRLEWRSTLPTSNCAALIITGVLTSFRSNKSRPTALRPNEDSRGSTALPG